MLTQEQIDKLKLAFMGPVVTKNGTEKHWGTDELRQHCIHLLDQLTVEQKLEFLYLYGYIVLEK